MVDGVLFCSCRLLAIVRFAEFGDGGTERVRGVEGNEGVVAIRDRFTPPLLPAADVAVV